MQFTAIIDLVIRQIDSCLILLTYKGKILLLQQDDILNQFENNSWHFIERIKNKNETVEKAIIREVEHQTQLILDSVSFVTSVFYNDRTEYLFHARLTDNHVNSIKREEGNILQFFTLPELKNLHLGKTTKLFISKYKALLE